MDSIIFQIREAFAQSIYFYTAHDQSYKILLFRIKLLESLQVLFSLSSLIAIICSLLIPGFWALGAAIFFSFILLSFHLFFNHAELRHVAEKHGSTALRLLELKESYLTLLTDMQDSKIRRDQTVLERNRLQEQMNGYQQMNLKPLESALIKARSILKTREELSFIEETSYALLPSYLQKPQESLP